MECRLSEAERVYIVCGAVDNERTDGRATDDCRPVAVCERDTLPSCHGSARLRVGGTDVLVGVKAVLGRVESASAHRGHIHFSVDCSANATPQFEGKGGSEFGASIAAALSEAYDNSFDYTALCVNAHQYCWTLHCDALILQLDGNAADIVSESCKVALATCSLPKLTVRQYHDGCTRTEVELYEPDDLEQCHDELQLETSLKPAVCSSAPQLVTVSKLGVANVVDLTTEEEQCAMAAVLFGIAPSRSSDESDSDTICLVKQTGKGSLDEDSLDEMMRQAIRSAAMRHHILTSFLDSGKQTFSD